MASYGYFVDARLVRRETDNTSVTPWFWPTHLECGDGLSVSFLLAVPGMLEMLTLFMDEHIPMNMNGTRFLITSIEAQAPFGSPMTVTFEGIGI